MTTSLDLFFDGFPFRLRAFLKGFTYFFPPFFQSPPPTWQLRPSLFSFLFSASLSHTGPYGDLPSGETSTFLLSSLRYGLEHSSHLFLVVNMLEQYQVFFFLSPESR